MLETVGNWLIAVPLGEPWRAIVLVASMLTFAFLLHWVWEFIFAGAGVLRKMTLKGASAFGAPARDRRQQPEVEIAQA
jgi:uncharacterized membrane protein YphA (DoxX/SURF4 family)